MRGGESVKRVKGGTGWSDVEEESSGAFIFKKIKRKELTQKKKRKKKKKHSQPRMRLDLPPGGFLRPPVAPLAASEGSEGCGFSCCCCSWSSCSASPGQSVDADAHE